MEDWNFRLSGYAKNLIDGLSVHIHDQSCALPQPRSQKRMREVRDRLLARSDGIGLGHRAGTEAADLREDEPHPVAGFLAAAQLRTYLRIHWRLRLNKTLEIVRAVQQCSSQPFGVLAGTHTAFRADTLFYTKEQVYA